MIDNSDYFDFSNWRLDSPQLNGINDEEKLNLINKNRKKTGLMKDECESFIIKEGVFLKSKSYALKMQGKYDKKEKKVYMHDVVEKITGKGVKNCVREKNLSFKKHVEALNKGNLLVDSNNKKLKDRQRKIIVKQNVIKSSKHTLNSISMEKVGLSFFDIKRQVNTYICIL